ncbi:MAG TPA: lysophospholipid acyltransferase family protein [Paludibacter sp.]|nr:lysophospholipid acyltransferase family protein [Paludibacter sp.]
MYYFLVSFCWLTALLPLRVLYLLADISYLLVYHVFGYRKNIVRGNLANSFPEKSTSELLVIEKRFYRFFCDLFIETIKQINMGEKEMKRRMVYENPEVLSDKDTAGKSIMLMTAHYGNWEWMGSLPLWAPADKPLYGVYKKLSSGTFDKLMCLIRSKFGDINIEKRLLLRLMVQLRSKNQPALFGMIADQSPRRRNIDYWTPFLNQDTPVLTGTEELARKFDYPVFYIDIRCVKRGYYRCKLVPISLQPKMAAEYEITRKYIGLLEETIARQPEYWLWSHRRWKYKRQQ